MILKRFCLVQTIFLITAALIGGCKDLGDPPPSAPRSASYANDIQPIFTASCVNAGCHPGGSAPFSLQAGVSYGNIVNTPATTGPCSGIPRVKPMNTDSSALVKRIEGNCGSRMPLTGAPLSLSQQTIIKDWINQGALDN